MTNVSHATLTGSQLHEPKGSDSAALGTVYVANGSGSGSWQSVGTSSLTGMVADFLAPVAPTGWLELDGSIISTSTFASLYAVMSIASSGTRSNGSTIITSIPSTSNFKVGWFVFGTGIATNTTIVSIDSSTQITLSASASSTGSGTFAVSPWLLNTGTIKLPDLTTAGRYRRSRTSSTVVGQTLVDSIASHTHTVSTTGSTDSQGAHTHTVNITDPGHIHTPNPLLAHNTGQPVTVGSGNAGQGAISTGDTSSATTGITAATVSAGAHTHAVTATGTAAATGSTETRPLSIVVITCIKT